MSMTSTATKHFVDPSSVKVWNTKEVFDTSPGTKTQQYWGWKNNTSRSCWMGEAKHDRYGITFLECLIAGGDKWGIRDYNWHEFHVVNCEFTGQKHEHGGYVESYGNGLVMGCYFHDIPAQAWQDAWRGHLSKEGLEVIDEQLCMTPGIQDFHDLYIENCGNKSGGGRAGFAISLFAAQGVTGNNGRRNQEIHMQNIVMRHRDGSGMICIQNRPKVTIIDLDAIYRSCNNFVWGSALPIVGKLITKVAGWILKPREAILIEDCDYVRIQGHLEGGNIKLNRCGTGPGTVLIQTTGNGKDKIFVDGKAVGPVQGGWNN